MVKTYDCGHLEAITKHRYNYLKELLTFIIKHTNQPNDANLKVLDSLINTYAQHQIAVTIEPKVQKQTQLIARL